MLLLAMTVACGGRSTTGPRLDGALLMHPDSVGTVTNKLSPCREPSCMSDKRIQSGFDEILQALTDSMAQNLMDNDVERLLLLADFSFALMSSEFLYRINSKGTVLDDYNLAWDTLSLQAAFELANAHGIALHCGQRTSFLLRLMNRLMPRPYFTVSLPGKHFYPVVMADTLAGTWVIVDPYDPFIITDDGLRVVDIHTAMQTSKARIHRTRRSFGPTQLLVSDSLLFNLYNGRRDWCGTMALWDSVALTNGDLRSKLSFDLDAVCHTRGLGGYRYMKPSPF